MSLLPPCSRRFTSQAKAASSTASAEKWTRARCCKNNTHLPAFTTRSSHILCLLDLWHFENATVNDSVVHGGIQKESWIPTIPAIAGDSPTTYLHVKLQPLTFLHHVRIVSLSFFSLPSHALFMLLHGCLLTPAMQCNMQNHKLKPLKCVNSRKTLFTSYMRSFIEDG